ncbi:unnamed protein product [Leptosia nina]|uniref:Leucine-rich repeat-containing protein 71 n=1 Tax=Leptosia nina TaxID=320188 RepID=A0AAV1JAK2_9NEOP
MKSERSIRSIKSTRSLRSSLKGHSGKLVTEIIDLEAVLPVSCAKFNCPYIILVKKTQQNDDYYRALKNLDGTKKRISMAQSAKQESVHSIRADDQESTSADGLSTHINSLTVTSVYDTFNCLTGIYINEVAHLPRILMQVMRYLVPHYKNITTVSITNCKLEASILYELSKIITVSTVVHVHLDGTSVAEANYAILLDTAHLKSLTLSRCGINDNVCGILASRLYLSATGEKLSLLNLSSNHITDVGAKSLAEALRTNRCLRYLNIADNHITDDGATSILNVLMEFPLTSNEVLNKRKRFITYLRRKNEMYLKYLADVTSVEMCKPAKRKKTSVTSVKSRSSARKEKETHQQQQSMCTDDSIRAKMLTQQLMGPFLDPFQSDCLKIHDGTTNCLGNMALAYLNMSYNDLSFMTIQTLRNVVDYQKCLKLVGYQTGLLKIVVDGNNMPIRCREMMFISEVLSGKNQEVVKRRKASKICA